MKIAVRLFARARELAGAESVNLELKEPASVGQLRQRLCEEYPALQPLAPRLLVAVGNDYAADDTPLLEGAEVACFPPVSGG